MNHYHGSHYRRQFVEGEVYVVGEDGCLLAIEVSTLVSASATLEFSAGHRSSTPLRTPRIPVATFVRRFFKHCQTVFRQLSDGGKRIHRYHRLARMKLVGEPGSREFAQSYLQAQRSVGCQRHDSEPSRG
jgi:hypothetical protein